MTTAEHLIKTAARKVEAIFAKTGNVAAMYHYVRESGEHVVFMVPPFLKDKNQVVAFAKTIFEAERAVAYVFIDEAWMLDTKRTKQEIDAAYDKYGSLEHVP